MKLADKESGMLQEFKNAVTEGLSHTVKLIKVFGSRARGDATDGSDLDLFLVVDHIDTELREKISEVAWEVGFENDVVLSTFVVTLDQLEHGPVGVSPIVRQIEREGIRL